MKPRNMYRIIIGAIMIISSIFFILMTGGEAIIGTIMLCAGMVFLITGITRHRRYGDDPESDERSKKIGAFGITYAWLTGLFFMTALFWLDYTGLLVLTTQNALGLSVVVLALSAVVYQAWLFRKGDVD
ncbi:MAG: hypothetical protein CVV32_08675 [Methanomicrobiales archaeon HGW-Methanomicrobiales-3]|nr:MAG: hypothetical protein CVV32_08675 [Methanomicrobiales archaeon HGW-Methanomicrobiales-3]